MSHARPEIIPFLTVAAFAGLRHAELVRLDWANITATHIIVKASQAKTAARRLIQLQPCLHSWLAPYRQESGAIVPFSNMSNQITALVEKSGVAWKHNGLRHSCISYRMAATNDENLVAAEAGNSPRMVHRHYKQLVTAEQAKEWFGILPAARTDSNIVRLAQ